MVLYQHLALCSPGIVTHTSLMTRQKQHYSPDLSLGDYLFLVMAFENRQSVFLKRRSQRVIIKFETEFQQVIKEIGTYSN